MGDLNNENITFTNNMANEGNDIYAVGSTDPSLSLSINNVTEGQPVLFEINADSSCSGMALVYVNNLTYTVNIVNGYGSATASLPYGVYTANAVFRGK